MKFLRNLLTRKFSILSANIYLQALVLIVIEWFAFYRIFSFWFFHGWEASWLMGNTGGIFTLQTLMQSHGFMSVLNLFLFGWDPKGWFFTAFLLHFLVTVVLMFIVGKITKNKLIGFITGLLFIATTADHDVITWGSFESLYAAQTLGIYITILLYLSFRQTGKKMLYFVSLITFGISSVLRESGIMLIPILFVFELLFYQEKLLKQFLKKRIDKKRFFLFVKLQLPFWIIGIAYLLLRASYGGSPYDYIDQRVQFRILLMHEHRYLEYVRYGILAFGQYIPPYIIPYPILNAVKEFFYTYLPIDVINNYFFVFLGWIFYTGFAFVLWMQRKSKYFKYLLFLLVTFTIITFFYSFAWTTDETFLSLPYSWSENRWRYFAFTALAPFFVISFYNLYNFFVRKFKKKYIFQALFYGILLLSIIVNVVFLNKIEKKMYVENHAPSIVFYNTLTKALPHLNSKTKFYYYRNSEGSLNDFLAEFYYIKQHFYPQMKTLPWDWSRSQMYFIIKYLSAGQLDLPNFYFIDYSLTRGVLNKTADVLAMFKSQKNIQLHPEINGDNTWSVALDSNLPVEFPYVISLTTALSPSQRVPHKSVLPSFTDSQINSLVSFMPDEVNFIHNTKVTVCKTMDNQINEEFHNYTFAHIADGNIQERSSWWADCRPAWVVFDLGQDEDISGFGWGSYNAIDYVPRDYSYETSSNGESWSKVLSVSANTQVDRLDKLSQPIKARYVRFMVDETVKRGMLMLNEFSIIPARDENIFDNYTSYKKLMNDTYSFWDKLSDEQFVKLSNANRLVAWIPFSWMTTPQNVVRDDEQTYYVPVWLDGNFHTYEFELPESELYSSPGQFLKRRINSITFSMPFADNSVSIDSMLWKPVFPSN